MRVKEEAGDLRRVKENQPYRREPPARNITMPHLGSRLKDHNTNDTNSNHNTIDIIPRDSI